MNAVEKRLPHPMSGIIGFLEVLRPHSASGWVWNPQDPDRPVEMDVRVSDRIVARVIANVPRPDLRAKHIGSGNYGFGLECADADLTAATFHVAGSSEVLALAPLEAERASSYRGYLDTVTPDFVAGWVWDGRHANGKLTVEILVDGKTVATGAADQFRADLKAAGVGDGAHAFKLHVAGAQNLVLSDVKARVRGANYILPADTRLRPLIANRSEQAPKQKATAPSTIADDYVAVESEFDAAFYVSRNSDAIPSDVSALEHFLKMGWREGRSPAPWFSVLTYLNKHADVAADSANPFVHYIKHGKKEGREIFPAESLQQERHFRHLKALVADHMDHNSYQSGATQPGADNALHYMFAGWKIGIDPCAWFSVHDYLDAYPDVRAAGAEPFAHYLSEGDSEGRQPDRRVSKIIEPHFDSEYYLSQKPILRQFSPLEHFVAFGWRQSLNPSRDFSVSTYLRLNPDIRKANVNPFWHYITAGRSEGRVGAISSRRAIAPSEKLPALLFIGHDGLHAGAQVVLLQIVKWFANGARHPIKVLLLGSGGLASQYAEYSDVYVCDNCDKDTLENDPELSRFLGGGIALCYINTVAAAKSWPIVARLGAPAVLHVHEMEGEISRVLDDLERLAPFVTCAIAVSQASRDALERTGRIAADRILVSHAFIEIVARDWSNIVEGRRSARETLGLERDAFVVIGCGTAYGRKGFDLFVDTALKCVCLSNRIRFVWIGAGADLEPARAKVAAARRQEEIRFPGFRADANLLLASADVFFLSSREDPFPLVCLEAAQYGIPTVYFDGATGISEFCRDDAGLGVPAFDIDAAAAALLLHFERPAYRERRGAMARARVLESYDTQQRMLEIFNYVSTACGLKPAVSVIVPAYNHQRFIAERIESIAKQTIKTIEIIVLDDASTDATVEVVRGRFDDPRLSIVVNAANAGSPFLQWNKGVAAARADFVWIAEGDDAADPSFLETLLPAFDDPDVNLAFCQTIVINENGERQPDALKPYYAASQFPFERRHVQMEGLSAVEAGFGAICLIVNASATLVRRAAALPLLRASTPYLMCGDWAFYLGLIRNAKLVYSSQTNNYFRRHTASVVHRLEGKPVYFEERIKIANLVIDSFAVTRATVRAMLASIHGELDRFASRSTVTREWLEPRILRLKAVAAAPQRPSWRIGVYVHGMLFSKGGIERIAAQVTSGLAERGHKVTVMCRVWGRTEPVYRLSESVEVVPVLDEKDLEGSKLRLRNTIAERDFDVVVAMLSEWLFEPIVEACVDLAVPVIASEHNDPWKIEELWWTPERRQLCFSKVSAIHLLLERFRASLPAEYQEKIFVIPNGIKLENGSQPSRRLPRIVAVGRLEPQKRHDRIIQAFALLQEKYPEWEVHIFGEGRERGRLSEQIAELGLDNRVVLRGVSEDIEAELGAASIFVIASEFEGFGIVVLEAQRAGLACIGYDNCNGPNDLITNGRDGLLIAADDTGETLAVALASLIENSSLREAMGEAGRQGVKRYDLNEVIGRWEAMIAETLRSKMLRDGPGRSVS